VQADILTGFRSKVLTVPLQAMIVRDAEPKEGEAMPAGPPKEEEGVYVVEEGKAVFKPIRTGLLGELSVEVLEGIEEGQALITGPYRELRDLEPGELVREQEAGEAAPPQS
jgi:HlyD family secretion protein